MKQFLRVLIVVLAGMAGIGSAMSPHTVNFACIDFLTWQVREGAADNWAQSITSPDISQEVHPLDAPFRWREGIRLSAGHQFSSNQNVNFILTHYNASAANHASGNIYSSFDANYFANNTDGANFGPFYAQANIRWKIFYNTLDLNVSHRFKLDAALILEPTIGLKIASINQTINTHWLNPMTTIDFTEAREDLKNNFWGIGPLLGVKMIYPAYNNNKIVFNFIGNIAGSLVYGHWDFDDIYQNNKPVKIKVNVQSVKGLSPMFNGLLGLEFIQHFATSDFSIRLGYEAQMWFNQVQLYTLDMGRVNRSLSLQGIDLAFKITC